MKKHLLTVILLSLAVVAFVLRFFVVDKWENCCDIIAFALSSIAALVEIILTERNGKITETEINKLKEGQLSVYVKDETLVIEKGVKDK